MRVSKNFNPHNLGNYRTYDIYSSILGLPVWKVKKFLWDVENLNGKHPDGKFSRSLTADEDVVFFSNGFKDVLPEYKQVLLTVIRKHLVRHFDNQNYRGRIGPRVARSELKFCRDEAIIEMFDVLIPGFKDIFKPKNRKINLLYTPMECGKSSR